jgi:hypothetical protein
MLEHGNIAAGKEALALCLEAWALLWQLSIQVSHPKRNYCWQK